MKQVVFVFLLICNVGLAQSSKVNYGFSLSPNYTNGLLVDDFEFTVWDFEDISATLKSGAITLNTFLFIEKALKDRYHLNAGVGISNIKHKIEYLDNEFSLSKSVVIQKNRYLEIPISIKFETGKKSFVQYGVSFLFGYYSSIKYLEYGNLGSLLSKDKVGHISIGSNLVNLNLAYGYMIYKASKFRINLKLNTSFGVYSFKKSFSNLTDNTIGIGLGAGMVFD